MALAFTESAILACDLGINVEVGVTPLELTLAEEKKIVEQLVSQGTAGVQQIAHPTAINLIERFDALQLCRRTDA